MCSSDSYKVWAWETADTPGGTAIHLPSKVASLQGWGPQQAKEVWCLGCAVPPLSPEYQECSLQWCVCTPSTQHQVQVCRFHIGCEHTFLKRRLAQVQLSSYSTCFHSLHFHTCWLDDAHLLTHAYWDHYHNRSQELCRIT